MNVMDTIRAYLEQKEFFKLRTCLNTCQNNISVYDYLRYKAVVENVFNKPDSSNAAIHELFAKYSQVVPDSIKKDLYLTEADNYIKLYQYKPAAEALKIVLDSYTKYLKDDEVNDTKNDFELFHALIDVPAQSIVMTAESTIPTKRDTVGLLAIPVTTAAGIQDFIFDSGANFSTASESFAQKINLKTIQTNIDVGNITGGKVKARLGVADHLTIGNAEINNVVFLVLPDEALTFPIAPGKNYTINGIIGFPVIKQLGILHIYRNGFIRISQSDSIQSLENFALDGLFPIVAATDCHSDTLIFHFDTGANETFFYGNYFKKYKNEIIAKGEKTSLKHGGAGGKIVESEIYTVEQYPLTIGGKTAKLQKARIFTESQEGLLWDEYFYGNIGQDFIRQFDEMTIDFNDMYISFR